MHIAIDVSPIYSAHSGRGIGSYTKNLVRALQVYEKKHKISVFTRSRDISPEADVVHYPYFDPYFLTLPLVKQKPTVVTVHDLIPLVFPAEFPAGVRGHLTWQIQKRSLFGAKRVITDSNSSKNDVIKIAGIQRDEIDTVYLASDPAYHPVTDPVALAGIRKKFSLPEEYILYVGDVNWNKNVPGLLEAFSTMHKQKDFIRFKFILVSRAFSNDTLPEIQIINRYINDNGLEDCVSHTGAVSVDDLSGIYSAATVCVQPSFYEGFGLPVLESMACGCPVVCTNTSSLKEIAGPALLVPPDISDLSSGIAEMIRTDRKEQQRRQFEWVKKFTWKKTARETRASYERALA